MKSNENLDMLDYSNNELIKEQIFMLRGRQIILDYDLAKLYGVQTKSLNQAVRRNIERFPCGFMFVLSKEELCELVTNCDRFKNLKHSTVYPKAFTEQGVAMLSAVLKSKTAIGVSVKIIEAFVSMRKSLCQITPIVKQIEVLERRQLLDQIKNEEKFEKIFEILSVETPPLQGVFFEGQLWDACSLVEKLIARAKSSILLIDNWVSVETLDMLAKKNSGVAVSIVSSKHGNKLASSDIAKFNTQYPTLTIKESAAFHDRFLILDDKEIYLIGASLKDLGKKCFAFTKMDASTISDIKLHI